MTMQIQRFSRCRHCQSAITQVDFLNGHSVWMHLDGDKAHRFCDPQPKVASPE